MNSPKLYQTELGFDTAPKGGRDTPVYIFPSKKLSNINIGIKHGLWAVGDIDPGQQASRETKADRMPIGAYGLFYRSDAQCFTVPFIIDSHPENKEISGVWPGTWHFPFRIRPLGDIGSRILLKSARHEWKALEGCDNVTKELRLSGGMAFVPSWLYASDWQIILQKLSNATDGDLLKPA